MGKEKDFYFAEGGEKMKRKYESKTEEKEEKRKMSEFEKSFYPRPSKKFINLKARILREWAEAAGIFVDEM